MHQRGSLNIVNTSVDKNCASVENKRKHPTFLENATDYGKEYTDYSGLHGVRYLGEQRRNIWEKLWWLIVLIVSLYFCITLILESYDKFANSPIGISTTDTPMPLIEIPLPAITICPNNKCRDTIYNYTEKLALAASGEIPDNELKEFYDAALACGSYEANIENIPTIPDRLNYSIDSNYYKFIEKVAPGFRQSITKCDGFNLWGCLTLFSTVHTHMGLCFTFNMLDKNDIYKSEVCSVILDMESAMENRQKSSYKLVGLDGAVSRDLSDYMMNSHRRNGWTFDEGYSKEALIHPGMVPINAVHVYSYDIGVHLSANEQDQTEEYRKGFQVMLHNPGEVPSFYTAKKYAEFNKVVEFIIKPNLIIAEEALRKYDPKTRNCYFSFERTLRYYQNYTQANCETECLTNYTLGICGCVSMWLPHNTTTKVCGHDKLLCAKQARVSIQHFYLEGYAFRKDNLKFGSCNCMPMCTYIKYNMDVDNAIESRGDQISTSLTFRFQETEFMALTRKVNYGKAEFMADCGGHLGLFIGFSFLSIFETVYFFSLRICCNVRRYGRHYWSGSSDLISQKVKDDSKEINTRPVVQREDISNEPEVIKLNKAVFNIDLP